MKGLAGLFPWFRGVRTRTAQMTGANSHVGNFRVHLIVVLDRQEICIHRFHLSTTGLGEHGLQGREPLYVSFESEQLSTMTIEQMCGRKTCELWLTKALTFLLFPSRALR